MKKVKLYLGGEEIDENKMMPPDFVDFMSSLFKDLFGEKR